MRPVSFKPVLFILGLGLAAVGSRAEADAWYSIDTCDSVSIAGQSYSRVTFSVHNVFNEPSDNIITFAMAPQTYQTTGDTCRVMQSTPPPNWKAVTRIDGGPGWIATNLAGWIPPGGTQSGFQMVLRHDTCCYSVGFGSGFDTPFAFASGCFACALPTPARPGTWGQVKAVYR